MWIFILILFVITWLTILGVGAILKEIVERIDDKISIVINARLKDIDKRVNRLYELIQADYELETDDTVTDDYILQRKKDYPSL